MLTKGVIQLNKKCASTSVKMVTFGSFKPTNIGPFILKTVEFRLINKVKNGDGLVSITTASGEVIWVHHDLINDEGWEAVGSRSTSEKTRKAKTSLRYSRQAIKA